MEGSLDRKKVAQSRSFRGEGKSGETAKRNVAAVPTLA